MVVKSSFLSVRQKQVFDFINSRTDAKVFYHSCGSVYDLIPEAIEIGVDILNPVQTSAAKMDLEVLKRQFGKDISFLGSGIDVQQKLPYYSLSEIEGEVKRTLDIMAPSGGFVFFPSHNIQANVTADRIDCMFRTVLDNRSYQAK